MVNISYKEQTDGTHVTYDTVRPHEKSRKSNIVVVDKIGRCLIIDLAIPQENRRKGREVSRVEAGNFTILNYNYVS